MGYVFNMLLFLSMLGNNVISLEDNSVKFFLGHIIERGSNVIIARASSRHSMKLKEPFLHGSEIIELERNISIINTNLQNVKSRMDIVFKECSQQDIVICNVTRSKYQYVAHKIKDIENQVTSLFAFTTSESRLHRRSVSVSTVLKGLDIVGLVSALALGVVDFQ